MVDGSACPHQDRIFDDGFSWRQEGQGRRGITKAMVTLAPALSGQVTVFSDKANPLRRDRAVALIQAL